MFGGCLQWLFWVIVYYGLWVVAVRTVGEILPFPPRCVFVCVSVLFLHFFFSFNFGKLNTGQGRYCTLFSLPRLCIAQHKKVDKISSPRHHLYLTFLCPVPAAPITKCVQRSWTASPQCQQIKIGKKKKPRQLSWIPPKSKQNWPQTKTATANSELDTRRDAKCLPVT